MLKIIEQLSILNSCHCTLQKIEDLPRKRILYYAEAFTRFNPSDLKKMTDEKRCTYLLLYCYVRQQQLIDKAIDMFTYLTGNNYSKVRATSDPKAHQRRKKGFWQRDHII